MSRLCFSEAQPAALKLLETAAGKYRSVAGYQAEGSVVLQGTTGKADLHVIIRKISPDRLRIEANDRAKGRTLGLLLVSDGDTAWLYSPKQNQYAQTLKTELTAAMDFGFDGMGLAVSLIAAAHKLFDPGSLTADVQETNILPDETILTGNRNALCSVVQVSYKQPDPPECENEPFSERVRIEELSRTLWIQKATLLIIRQQIVRKKLILSSGFTAGATQVTTVDIAPLNRPFPDELFRFTPPEESTRVQVLFWPEQTCWDY
jgi:outer membrane lipoprotein-sorting protein